MAGPDPAIHRSERAGALEPLQQAVEIIQLIARAVAFAGAPAQLVEDFPRALEIGFVRHLDVAGIHLAGTGQRTAERILRLAELIQPVGIGTARLMAETLDEL